LVDTGGNTWLIAWMKKFFLALFAGLIATQLLAADADWLTSLPDALAQAKKENKLVLMDFTGSDWCEGCIAIDKEVFTKPAFNDYAKTNLVLVQVDFPIKKPQSDALAKANDALQKQYNVDGYPTLILLKPDGTVLHKDEGYKLGSGPASVISEIESARKK
jgi:thioredoxin-related protein